MPVDDAQFARLQIRVEALEERLADVLAAMRQLLPHLSPESREIVAAIAGAAAGRPVSGRTRSARSPDAPLGSTR